MTCVKYPITLPKYLNNLSSKYGKVELQKPPTVHREVMRGENLSFTFYFVKNGVIISKGGKKYRLIFYVKLQFRLPLYFILDTYAAHLWLS